MRRGEIWWGETPTEKGRPYLVIHRAAVIGVIDYVLVAPITRRTRALPTELMLGRGEGLPADCVAAFDTMQPFWKGFLTRRIGALDSDRADEICNTAMLTIGC